MNVWGTVWNRFQRRKRRRKNFPTVFLTSDLEFVVNPGRAGTDKSFFSLSLKLLCVAAILVCIAEMCGAKQTTQKIAPNETVSRKASISLSLCVCVCVCVYLIVSEHIGITTTTTTPPISTDDDNNNDRSNDNDDYQDSNVVGIPVVVVVVAHHFHWRSCKQGESNRDFGLVRNPNSFCASSPQ